MSNSTEYAFYVGIDWADSKHDVAIVTPNGVPKVITIEHSTESIDAFVSDLLSYFGQKLIGWRR